MSVYISGVGYAPVRAEYTSGEAIAQYTSYMTKLKGIMDKGNNNLDGSDYNYLVLSMQGLANIAVNGVNGTYLTKDMLTNIDLVVRSLEAVGINNSSQQNVPNGVDIVRNWQSLSGLGVEQILNNALQISPTAGRSLQSMIELEYVKQGNDLIFAKLNGMESALKVTQNVIDTLNVIQGIADKVTIQNRGSFAFSAGTTVSAYESKYKMAASQFFTQLIPTTAVSNADADLLWAQRVPLAAAVQQLDAANPAASHTVPNSLSYFLNNILQRILTTFTGQGQIEFANRIKAWVLDNTAIKLSDPASSSAGAVQTSITQAIQAAQSLNDTQKKNVSNYMFVFEEFYKSSSAVLQQVTQIIQSMAQGIGR